MAADNSSHDQPIPTKVLSAGAAPFIPSYISVKEQHDDPKIDKKITPMNNYPQFQDANDPCQGPRLPEYDGNYYPNVPPLIPASCTRIPSPRMPGRNDNMPLSDQYLSSNCHPFIPIPYQYSQNFISDKNVTSQRSYYPLLRNYDRRKVNKMQPHLRPSHDLQDNSIKDDIRDNGTSHPTHDVNQIKTDTKDNIENRRHKNNASTMNDSVDIVKETKNPKKKNKRSSINRVDKNLSTTPIKLSQDTNAPLNEVQQDSDLCPIKTLYPSSTNKFKNDDFPELKVNPESHTSKSTTAISYSQILQMQPTKQRSKITTGRRDESGKNSSLSENSCSSDDKCKTDNVEEPAIKSKKKKKKKKKKVTIANAKVPDKSMTINLGEMISRQYQTTNDTLEKSKSTKKGVTVSLGISNPNMHSSKTNKGNQRSQLPTKSEKKVKPLNPLDSSAPAIMYGKQRETPKKKKPSVLKRVILKERSDKKRLKDSRTQSLPNIYEETELAQITDEIRHSSLSVIMHHSVVGTLFLAVTKEIPDDQLTEQLTKSDIHSRKFREYCDHVLTKEINNYVWDLLRELVRFQDRQYQRDPVKAKIRRRYVLGLREVQKYLRLKKIKCVVISPNLEKITSEGGIDHVLQQIIETCHFQSVPVVFGLNRYSLGKAVKRHVPVSIVGVVNYDGVHDKFHELMELVKAAREEYKNLKLKKLQESIIILSKNNTNP